jgi:hypothetical protein
VTDEANQRLAAYLKRRLENLQSYGAEIESRLQDDKQDLLKGIDEGRYAKEDPQLGKAFFHIEFVLGVTFRYTLLVGICSFLEEAIKTISSRIMSDYESKLKGQKRGSWLEKHIAVLGVHLPQSVRAQVECFGRLITLRNCIVHAWGKISACRNPNAVKKALQAIEEQTASMNLEIGCITRDGYLYLAPDIVPHAIIAAEEIVDALVGEIPP